MRPIQTVKIDGKTYQPQTNASLDGADSDGTLTMSVRGPVPLLVHLGLLVEMEFCPAAKDFVARHDPTDVMTFRCDKPIDEPHDEHHDPSTNARWR